MKHYCLIFLLLCTCLTSLRAEEIEVHTLDSASHSIVTDTLPLTQKQIDRLFFRPDPVRAVWLGALVPGLGQIYNRSYWKLPIVYGGVMGCAFGITYMQDLYSSYSTAYRDLYYDIEHNTVSETSDRSYIAVLPRGYTLARMGGASSYCDRLSEWQSTYRRYRDLSIMAAVLVYALSLVDAYVDAQLFDFDVSDNLSVNVSPNIYYDMHHQASTELHLAITF